MGMAKLNVFVSALDDPCKISSRTWYVNIYNCDGSILEYCGKKYAVQPAKCGHLEIEVPPGCYRINAVWGFKLVGRDTYRANHFTDSTLVTACCEQTACVKLFNPNVHRCGYIYALAVRDLVNQKVINPELGRQLEDVVREINERAGRPERQFEQGIEKDIDNFLAEEAQKGKGKKKK